VSGAGCGWAGVCSGAGVGPGVQVKGPEVGAGACSGLGTGGPEVELAALPEIGRAPVTHVPLADLLPADSPRQGGEDFAHARALAKSPGPLLPIIVSRATMRVIDGMHRLLAAGIRRQATIGVRFFDGDEASGFVLAVRANVAHGLPLSLADRKAAAVRILESHPQWSTRMVASVAGLAARTVAELRARPGGKMEQLDTRLGRDGRLRPVDGAARRALAGRLILAEPEASLRSIARRVGISPETVRAVRAGLRAERDASGPGQSMTRPPERRHPDGTRPPGAARGANPACDPRRVLTVLRADPAVRSTELGRAVLRALAASLLIDELEPQLTQSLPEHCRDHLAEAARACAETWRGFARQMSIRQEDQLRETGLLTASC